MNESRSDARRVLMTADTVGGVWTYALELARALAPHGVEVVLATMGAQPSGEQKAESHAIPNLWVFASGFKLEWMEDPWEEVCAAGEWLLELEGLLRPDVIHLNGYAHGALPWQSPVLMVAHSCVLSWWQAVKNEPAPSSWDRYRSEVRRGLGAAGMVVAPTRAMLDSVVEYYGPLPRTRVIPNGRDASLFRSARKEKLIFAAGRLWDEAKNLTALERAARHLSWPVCVAGDGRHPDGRVARATSVCHVGRLSSRAVARWLARASVYALPARYEPFGLSVLEAALSECALVLGDIESLRENWAGAAVFVPPDDPRALEDALEMLMRDSTRREALAAQARQRALELTPEGMAAGYRAAYAALTSEAARPPTTSEERVHCGSSSSVIL